MEYLPWALAAVFGLLAAVLLVKIRLLQKGADEIAEDFAQRLATDTNTVIGLSTRDRHMRKLAASINVQLRLLRQQRRRYLMGDRELKEAVTNISHDLRTPLTAICGYLDLLAREDKSETVARYLSQIENRTEAMKQLTEELFRYSVILSTENLDLEPVNVGGVLEESVAGFYAALTERGIEPVIQMPEGRVVRSLNKAALARIFSNLLSNALKYSDGDLEITLLETGEITFSNHASRLDEIQVGRLFDRFFSVESAQNATGLGLSIAKTLAEQMHGTITAHYAAGTLTARLRFPET